MPVAAHEVINAEATDFCWRFRGLAQRKNTWCASPIRRVRKRQMFPVGTQGFTIRETPCEARLLVRAALRFAYGYTAH